MAKAKAETSADTAANLGFEAKLWLTADKLRNNMDAAEYKHVVLGLIFLKYISDAFEERHQTLLAEVSEGADPEDPDEHCVDNVSWVPTEARWKTLQDNAKQPTIGKLIDEAMVAIERDNPRLKGILPKDAGDDEPDHSRHRRRPRLGVRRRDLEKDLMADYVLANPPFNDSDWCRSDEGVRWKLFVKTPHGKSREHFAKNLSLAV